MVGWSIGFYIQNMYFVFFMQDDTKNICKNKITMKTNLKGFTVRKTLQQNFREYFHRHTKTDRKKNY